MSPQVQFIVGGLLSAVGILSSFFAVNWWSERRERARNRHG